MLPEPKWERRGFPRRSWFYMVFGLNVVDGWASLGQPRAREPAGCLQRTRWTLSFERALLAHAHSLSGSGDGGTARGKHGDGDGDQEGRDLMSQLMEEVNQREGLLRRESLRLLNRPSALLPPHSVLEHVLGSLRTPDFPTDAAGLQQAFLFTALGEEASHVDYRRDWSDDTEQYPRYLDKESFENVLKRSMGFLVGMADFYISGAPYFSEDDHRVTFSVRVIPDKHTSTLRWVNVDFRLGRARQGSHKDCWLLERAMVRDWDWDGPPSETLL